MTSIDLSDYTLAELRGLLFEIDTAIRERDRERIAAARAHAHSIAQAVGLSLDDLADDTGRPLGKKDRTL